MSNRAKNESKFGSWEDLAGGGRRYWFEVGGRNGWKARYVKEVDDREETVRFYQELYDPEGVLIEVHEKFPVDRGHLPAKEWSR